MSETKKSRQAIINKLKYLKQHWKDAIEVEFPNASPSYYTYFNFLNFVHRERVEVPVKCSNYQDTERIYVSEIDKETLENFLKNLPECAILRTSTYEDDYGHIEVYLEAYQSVWESDEVYSLRLSNIVSKLEYRLHEKQFPFRRAESDERKEELNRYIEYLENR